MDECKEEPELSFLVYTKPDCPFCAFAKAILRSTGKKFATQDFTSHPEYGQKTMTWPQVYLINDERDSKTLIGGADSLQVYLNKTA